MKSRIPLISLAVLLALSMGVIGCEGEGIQEYKLTVFSPDGGEITTPGDGTSTYEEGTEVPLVALPQTGYRFVNWSGDVDTIANINSASTTITMNGDYSITANFAVKQYDLTISSTEGGSVTTPGEGISTYDEGTVVNLVAQPSEGYQFTEWTGNVGAIADVNGAQTTITMNSDYSITADFAGAIRDWYDLDAIRDNLDGSYILMNDLDSTSAGYEELASPTANGGKGWLPIGGLVGDPVCNELVESVEPFNGNLNGQGREITDPFIHRPEEDGVGLFGCIAGGGVIDNIRVTNVDVIGRVYVGALVGLNRGIVRGCCSNGSMSGSLAVGGLGGWNYGTVSNSHSGSSVSGDWAIGGLIGLNHNMLHGCYATGSVTGDSEVGGLVGGNAWGKVSDSYSSGSIIGRISTGGLVGRNWGSTVINSHYNCDEVLINEKHLITVGALSGEDFEEWLANDKLLDIGERLLEENGWYLIRTVDDLKQLLLFGQDSSLKFRLTTDLDLADEPGLYIPYLAGKFDGDGHKIANLSFSFDFVSSVGLFGHLASGGELTGVALEDVDIVGATYVGGLVGLNDGIVSNSYSKGSVSGSWIVGGLVGETHTGVLSNSYSSGTVSGDCAVGGLVGHYNSGDVRNCYYNRDEVRVNGQRVITVGALSGEDFEEWLANGNYLDINARLSQEDGYYLINDVDDFRQLLAFGQDSSLEFRLMHDLDLATQPNLYIPYLAGKFDGNGHEISNLRLSLNFVAQVGLFGCISTGGELTRVGAQNAHVAGCSAVGGLVGYNSGTVSHSYVSGTVTGDWSVGGLMGFNAWGATVRESYSGGSVTGSHDIAGGLVARNDGAVHRCFAASSVVGPSNAGGLVGYNRGSSTVSNSFWDTQASGQTTSAGGTGKTTAGMKDIATFSGATWNIVAVGDPSTRNPSYIWNIVDGETYPFLSWQA